MTTTKSNKIAPCFSWLPSIADTNGDRAGSQESLCGRGRIYVVRRDGSVELGRWMRLGDNGRTLEERAL